MIDYLFEVLNNIDNISNFLGLALVVIILWHTVLGVFVENIKPLPKVVYVIAVITVFFAVLIPNNYTYTRITEMNKKNLELTKQNVELQTQITKYQIQQEIQQCE